MTDKQWESVINKCRKAGDKHIKLLKIAEDEYIRRFGSNPSEVDDDWWIDLLHYCQGDSDLQTIIDNAEFHSNKNK